MRRSDQFVGSDVGALLSLEQRADDDADAVSLAEIAGRIDGLLRLRTRALAERPRLLAAAENAATADARREILTEANAAAAAADGVLDEVARLHALAGMLRRAGAAW